MTTTDSSRVPIIVENERAFTDTLFRPIDGRTADGYVHKRGKWFVDIFIAGRKIRINRHLVPCIRTEFGEWQHAVLLVPFTLAAQDEAYRKLSIGSEWNGAEIYRRFA